MDTPNIKSDLHKLIDNINDEGKLKKAYTLIESLSVVNDEGILWASLTEKEKEELLEIEKESHDPDN